MRESTVRKRWQTARLIIAAVFVAIAIGILVGWSWTGKNTCYTDAELDWMIEFALTDRPE